MFVNSTLQFYFTSEKSDSLGPELGTRALWDYLGARECNQTWQKAK